MKKNAQPRAAVPAPTTEETPFDPVGFIIAAEDGSLTQEEFERDAQKFVDSGVWRHLQGSWQRAVLSWVDAGHVTIN